MTCLSASTVKCMTKMHPARPYRAYDVLHENRTSRTVTSREDHGSITELPKRHQILACVALGLIHTEVSRHHLRLWCHPPPSLLASLIPPRRLPLLWNAPTSGNFPRTSCDTEEEIATTSYLGTSVCILTWNDSFIRFTTLLDVCDRSLCSPPAVTLQQDDRLPTGFVTWM